MTRELTPSTDLQPLPDDDWAWTFLETYLNPQNNRPGVISQCLRAAKISRDVYQNRLKDDLQFALLVNEAREQLIDALEGEAYRRAFNPDPRPIYQRGELVGHAPDVDNRHLEWYLERARPDKWHIPSVVEFVSGDAPGAFKFQMGETPLELEAGEGPPEE